MNRLLFIHAIAVSLAVGQGLTSLSGVVIDPTGAVLPSADLTLINIGTQHQRQSKSDGRGRYLFAQVQPGSYKIQGKAAGFSDVIVNDVELRVNQPATITVRFEKVGAVAETISVSADAVQVNTSDASLGNAISTQPILQLPFFARNVAGLLAFQPGVTAVNNNTASTDYVGANPATFGEGTIDDRNGAVNGGKSDQANVTLDGIDVNDQATRRAFKSVLRSTLDSVQEFRTITANGGAEFGRSSGAQVALVTRSGSNDIHGALYEYHRNTKTAANTFFNNLSGVKRPALLIDVFGGRIGGPILKNKLFYFANYEGRRDRSATNVLRTAPSELMRQGSVQYRTTAGTVATLSPTQVRAIDPGGIGPNPASLRLLQTYPVPNDFTTGDGLNIIGYRFTAPQKTKFDTYITKFDWTLNSKHSLFLRGNLQNDHSSGVPQYPGEPPNSVGLDNSKGIATGLTSVLNANWISTFRYGYTRQGAESTGIQAASATTFRNLDTRYGLTRGISRIIPTHHITQDFAWLKGAHDVRFGGTLRWIENKSNNYNNSFNAAAANLSWLRGTGQDLQAGVPDLSPQFRVAYGDAMMAVLGIISQGTGNYNYNIDGSVLPTGAPVARRFRNDEYEMYVQDTWRVTRALTVTGGLRYSLMPPVYEADGIQVSADRSLGGWFNTRGGLADQGKPQTDAGLISFVLANSPQGRPLYDYHKKNFAPRLALAYSPQSSDGIGRFLFGEPGRTSIRAGWGMYYDLFGQGLIRAVDARSFGLSTSLTNPSGQLTSATAPRFTGFNDVPPAIVRPPPSISFPAVYPSRGAGSFAITNSIDDTIVPPYSMNLSFSIGREFSHGLFVEGSYVGRLSRRSLIARDLAMPTNFRDQASNSSWYEAASQLAILSRARVPVGSVPRIPFFENMFSNLATAQATATQAVYNVFRFYPNDETSALADLDHFSDPGCSRLGCNAMFSPQFSALGGLSSVAGGNYHAMQWTVRKRFSDGLLFNFNYTMGKSTDLSSNSEYAQGPNGPATIGYAGLLINSWEPGQRKGVSDYDMLHIMNAFAVWELPFGRGRQFGTDIHRALDAIVGGWQLSPAFTIGSGLPVSVGNGRNWPTNWNITGWATSLSPVTTDVGSSKNAPAVTGRSGPNLFADPSKALPSFGFTLPGQTGNRNSLRGDGPFIMNLGVAKRFMITERHSVQFRVEAFNLTNTARFNVSSLTLDLGNTGSFGKYSGTLAPPRQMQFALRYEF